MMMMMMMMTYVDGKPCVKKAAERVSVADVWKDRRQGRRRQQWRRALYSTWKQPCRPRTLRSRTSEFDALTRGRSQSAPGGGDGDPERYSSPRRGTWQAGRRGRLGRRLVPRLQPRPRRVPDERQTEGQTGVAHPANSSRPPCAPLVRRRPSRRHAEERWSSDSWTVRDRTEGSWDGM